MEWRKVDCCGPCGKRGSNQWTNKEKLMKLILICWWMIGDPACASNSIKEKFTFLYWLRPPMGCFLLLSLINQSSSTINTNQRQKVVFVGLIWLNEENWFDLWKRRAAPPTAAAPTNQSFFGGMIDGWAVCPLCPRQRGSPSKFTNQIKINLICLLFACFVCWYNKKEKFTFLLLFSFSLLMNEMKWNEWLPSFFFHKEFHSLIAEVVGYGCAAGTSIHSPFISFN